MASYDSDSSEGEFTETNVLLGYASRDAQEETVSKLGGTPDWLDADKPPSAALARCKACRDLLVLILQLNAELPDKFPNHERRLYVFACRREKCRRKNGSIRALRGVRAWRDEDVPVSTKQTTTPAPTEEPKPKINGPGLGDALFGSSPGSNPFSSNANPFSSGGGDASKNPFSSKPTSNGTEKVEAKLSKTFAETLSLHDPTPTEAPSAPEPWPEPSAQTRPYPTLYLAEADYETLEPTSTKIPEHARVEEADAPETVSALDKEAFESSLDATFQKFADRLAQNPEQVIRYEFGGTPLLYSKTDEVGEKLGRGSMPACPNCRARRTFEVQLTPNAIAELEADDMSLAGMEWGTIIVGVCERDCVPGHVEVGEAGYLEEWAGVQWEELTKQK